MKFVVCITVLIAFLAPALVGCSKTTGRTAGQSVDDATITGEIKGKLINDPRVSAMKIDVDSYKGNVTLTGQVPDRQAEQQAIRIAQGTGGVKSVRSNLLIAGQTTPTGAQKTP